jgi:hypothetical protein
MKAFKVFFKVLKFLSLFSHKNAFFGEKNISKIGEIWKELETPRKSAQS